MHPPPTTRSSPAARPSPTTRSSPTARSLPTAHSSPTLPPDGPSPTRSLNNKSPDVHSPQPSQSTRSVSPPLDSDQATQNGHHPPQPLARLSPEQTNGAYSEPPPVSPSLSPCLHSPPRGTSGLVPPPTLVIDSSNQTTDGQSLDTSAAGHAGRVPPLVGTFTFNGQSPFITPAAVEYLHTIPGGQSWEKMITSYLRLEGLPINKRVCIISTPYPTGTNQTSLVRYSPSQSGTTQRNQHMDEAPRLQARSDPFHLGRRFILQSLESMVDGMPASMAQGQWMAAYEGSTERH